MCEDVCVKMCVWRCVYGVVCVELCVWMCEDEVREKGGSRVIYSRPVRTRILSERRGHIA